jgi:hypothetical protein
VAGLVVMCAAFVVAGIEYGGSVMVMSDSVSPSFRQRSTKLTVSSLQIGHEFCNFHYCRNQWGPEQGEQILIFHLRNVGKLQVDGK